jgi:hypothetical protein
MPISEKTRKILWGRSGNKCAKCRRELIISRTAADDESVVGDECHIVSGKNQGPRYDPTFPVEQLDEPENLILLCRVHHKMVDDQYDTYTVQVLRRLKENHERWVSSTLAADKPPVPEPDIRLRVSADTPRRRFPRFGLPPELALRVFVENHGSVDVYIEQISLALSSTTDPLSRTLVMNRIQSKHLLKPGDNLHERISVRLTIEQASAPNFLYALAVDALGREYRSEAFCCQ